MAGKTASEFTIDLKRFGKLTRDKATIVFKKVALDLDSRIVFSTPVDLGRARGNWFPSINLPSNNVSLNTFDKNGGATVAKIAGTVSGAKLGDTLWLSNNLDYIGKLENGSSTQAPQGMVAVNVAAVSSFYAGRGVI